MLLSFFIDRLTKPQLTTINFIKVLPLYKTFFTARKHNNTGQHRSTPEPYGTVTHKLQIDTKEVYY